MTELERMVYAARLDGMPEAEIARLVETLVDLQNAAIWKQAEGRA